MYSAPVPLEAAIGKTLATPVFSATGLKLFARGRVLAPADAAALQSQGLRSVWVIELEGDEVPEAVVLAEICMRLSSPGLELRSLPGARAELYCTQPSLVLANRDLMRELNGSGVAVFASLDDLSFAQAGESIAMIRARPFAAERGRLQDVLNLLEREGTPFVVKPIGHPAVTGIFVDPLQPHAAKAQFSKHLRTRLSPYGVDVKTRLSLDDEETLSAHLADLAQCECDVVLVASTTSPIDPDDALGRAIQRLGKIQSYLAPVEPGSLLLIGQIRRTTVISAAGCLRNTHPNVLDYILPALLAHHSVKDAVADFGVGGFLRGPAHGRKGVPRA